MKQLPNTLLEKPNLSQFLWETFLRYRTWSITVLILRCISMSEKIMWPFFIKLVIDYLVMYQKSGAIYWNQLFWILLLGFVIWFGVNLADITTSIISGRKIAAIRAGTRLLVLNDMYRQSLQFFYDRFAGSIGTSIRDLSETVSDVLNEIIYQFIPAIIVFLCLGVVFFKIYVGYTLLMAVWVVLQVTLIYLTKRNAQKRSRIYADERSELVGKIIDSITNHFSVSSFTAREHEYDIVKKAELGVIERRVEAVHYMQKVNLLTGVLEVGFIFFGFIGLYLNLYQKGLATAGDFMFMIAGIHGMMGTVKEITGRVFWIYEQIGIGQEAIRKVVTPSLIQDKTGAAVLQIRDAAINIRNLEFSYLANKPVLSDVSFHIEGGQKLGLVGYSGAGKTTFVNLLMRFYDVTGGSIMIDDQDIRDVTQESLRRNIALIPQDTSLFHRSLKENIRIARPDASDEEIFEAASMAGAHDFILSLSKQYDTLVGERGIKLSGGQRQRIAIARAFLKAAPILILDEATSALDSMTEKSIQDALDKVMAGRTTIVIAHRLSTLRQMDRILVFD
jgi:ATP-binding cassette subfamily B protein